MVDWNDNKKRKAFREALQAAYPSGADLEIFVDEELNENLAIVAGGDNLQVTAYSLVKWAKAKRRLDEVYNAFKKNNPSHAVIKTIESQSFISQTFNLTQDDWDMLFGQFLLDDLADLQRAFWQGFREAIGIDFRLAQPTHPPLVELTQIRELLEIYDADEKGPILAVRFAESVIAELQRSREGKDRDLNALKQWRDRITEKFDVRPPAPSQKMDRHAYLLVTLEEIGSDVNVYPELWIVGEEKPVSFGAEPTTCPIDQVADRISEWIRQSEDFLLGTDCDDKEVTLEVFLPCQYLAKDIAEKDIAEDIETNWRVKNDRGELIILGTYRRFLVRSSDRIRNGKIQAALKLRWKKLEDCVEAKDAWDKFHRQANCPQEKGNLCALLKDNKEAPVGLKFVAQLPTDPRKCKDLFYDIIDAAIPIALWSSDPASPDASNLETEFDNLLQQCYLTNFADLARQWRQQRLSPGSAKYIRLLCDRPDRLPRLPDLKTREDEDAIVAC